MRYHGLSCNIHGAFMALSSRASFMGLVSWGVLWDFIIHLHGISAFGTLSWVSMRFHETFMAVNRLSWYFMGFHGTFNTLSWTPIALAWASGTKF